MKARGWFLAALALASVASVVRGESAPPAAPVPADAAQASPDFALQGEYEGTAGERKLAAQVIALGGGTFEAAFLRGGLPGAGWDRTPRVRVPGRIDGEAARFEGGGAAGWSGRIAAGVFAGRTGDGAAFRLRKVERRSPTLGLAPPPGAQVLFDGRDAGAWENARTTGDGLLEAGTRTRSPFRDFTLHVEFRTPFRPEARGQRRGNSGVYLLGRYEIQILDSFGLDGAANECGAIYRQRAPDVNMCLPPLAWQTYDIDFEAARFEGDRKVRNAGITLRHNGVTVHDRVEIPGPTGGAARRPELGTPAPIAIQNHGNPVHLRNIWLVEK